MTADGSVPLVHQVYAGNQTDDRLHPENHQRRRRLLQRADFIYVADCQLATEENRRRLAGCGGRFVSVVRQFHGVERYEVQHGEHFILFPAQLNRLQHLVLELLEVPRSLYQ